MNLFSRSDALVSDCGKYRYWLSRVWNTDKPMVTWIMLNPSTADAEKDDPTIRRCMSFSDSWGFGGLYVVNLYAFRATNPKDLWKAEDPVGVDNDYYLQNMTAGKHVIIGWGSHAPVLREEIVMDLIRPMSVTIQALGLNKNGSPKHPLYVAANTKRQSVI